MKILLHLAVCVTVALPAFSAVQYTYIQKNSTDSPAEAAKDLTARATIDGDRSRVEFLSGNTYPPETYVVSNDGSRRLYFVDPKNRWFTEVDSASMMTSLGAGTIKISDFKSDLERMDDTQVIAGIPADHYRLHLSYDISLTLRGIALSQRVTTDIDSWTTMRFAGAVQGPVPGQGRTGNAELDQLIDAETTRIPGFKLRQITTTRTYYEPKSRTKLEIPTTRTMTREMIVTSVAEVQADPSLFIVPATFRRSDQPELANSAHLKFEN